MKRTLARLSDSETATFCSQISMILRAGVPLEEGVMMMLEDTEDAAGKEILRRILEVLQMGAPFCRALEECGCFPKYVLDMVRIGEASGRLDDVMDSLGAYYERNRALARSIKSAVTYPAVMIVMMLAVIFILIVKGLPVFSQVFEQLGSRMSALALGIMNFGQAAARYSAVLVGIIAVLAAGLFLMRRTPDGKRFLSRIGGALFPKLYTRIAAGRFASAMSMMLDSGLDVDQSLGMSGELLENEAAREKVNLMKRRIGEGASFADAVAESGIFPGVYARLISMGFKTGSADAVMRRIADSCDEETEGQLSRMIAVLEPTLVAILSIVVGMILLSVMLPLMGIMTSIT